MSNFEQAMKTYKKVFADKLERTNYDESLLRGIAKYLGPSIYSNDSSKVACSNKAERDSIKTNFLIKKLKLKESKELDEAIVAVCKLMGSANRNKYRTVFYYLLVEIFEKQSVFLSEEKPIESSSEESISKDGNASTDNPTDIIERHALYAAGAGLVPIPLLDLASISVVQYRMIKKLAGYYDHVSFEEQKTKSTIAGLVGGFSSFELGLITRVLFRGIPIIGPVVAGTAVSGYAYYSTKLIGQIFEEHFTSGGDLSIEELGMKKMKEAYKKGIHNFKSRTT